MLIKETEDAWSIVLLKEQLCASVHSQTCCTVLDVDRNLAYTVTANILDLHCWLQAYSSIEEGNTCHVDDLTTQSICLQMN